VPQVVLKLELTKAVFTGGDLPGFLGFVGQVAWSF
jgi:hypothetical protein